MFKIALYDCHTVDGVFGAHMCVMLENDGPVTLEIDSNHKSSTNILPSQVKVEWSRFFEIGH